MLWRVRTTLDDRPGALAQLATHCGSEDVNIVGMQIFPTMAGVVDELILHPPAEWDAEAVAELIERSGGREVAVVSCTAHSLQDPPTRYLRAATRLLDAPEGLVPALERLFDCASGSADAGPHVLRLDGPGDVVLRREWAAFTDAERARAGALADLVERIRTVRATGAEAPDDGPRVSGPPLAGRVPRQAGCPTVRFASPSDVEAVHLFHTRCSFQTLLRGYPNLLSAGARQPDGALARDMTSGLDGVALLAETGGLTVGTATLVATSEPGVYELALLVEDAWQRRGIGSVLLGHAAGAAAPAGEIG